MAQTLDEWRRIRAEQDKAYSESLESDQEKVNVLYAESTAGIPYMYALNLCMHKQV